MCLVEEPIFVINGQPFVIVRGTTAGEVFTWEEAAKSTKDVRVHVGNADQIQTTTTT